MKKNASSSKEPLNIILLGDIAAGKGTQAELLAKKYPLYDLDMGREIRKPENRAKHDFAATTGKGHLTPTQVVRSIFDEKIGNTPRELGILFNGTPKMIGEARRVCRLLRENKRTRVLFLYLSIPLSETMKRLEIRRKKEGRMDDDAEAAKRRYAGYYRTQIATKIVPYFRERYPYKKISGVGSKAEVQTRLIREIKKYLPK